MIEAQNMFVRCEKCRYAHITDDGKCVKYCDNWCDENRVAMELYLPIDFYCAYAKPKNNDELEEFRPVVHGYWEKSTDRTFMSPCYECSNCGRKINTYENPCKSAPYCHCGSKMDDTIS